MYFQSIYGLFDLFVSLTLVVIGGLELRPASNFIFVFPCYAVKAYHIPWITATAPAISLALASCAALTSRAWELSWAQIAVTCACTWRHRGHLRALQTARNRHSKKETWAKTPPKPEVWPLNPSFNQLIRVWGGTAMILQTRNPSTGFKRVFFTRSTMINYKITPFYIFCSIFLPSTVIIRYLQYSHNPSKAHVHPTRPPMLARAAPLRNSRAPSAPYGGSAGTLKRPGASSGATNEGWSWQSFLLTEWIQSRFSPLKIWEN